MFSRDSEEKSKILRKKSKNVDTLVESKPSFVTTDVFFAFDENQILIFILLSLSLLHTLTHYLSLSLTTHSHTLTHTHSLTHIVSLEMQPSSSRLAMYTEFKKRFKS